MRCKALACAVITLSLLLGTRADAQQEKYNKQAAKAAFLEARRAESKKDWKEAAKQYGIAYGESKDPSLFYYMATAFKNDGNCEFAIIYYTRFLQESQPKPDVRAKTEGAVKACKKKLGIKDEPKKDPDEGKTGDNGKGTTGSTDKGDTKTDPPDQPAGIDPETGLPYGYKEGKDKGSTATSGGGEASGMRIAGWVSLGLAAAFGAGGTVFALTSNARENDIQELLDFRTADGQARRFEGALQEEYDDKVDEGKRYNTMAKVAFGAAGVAAVATVVFFVIDGLGDSPSSEGEGNAMISPTVTPDGSVGVAAGWRF